MKTYHGSCHCKSVQFEADIDLGRGTIKCNCTICTKMRFWAVQVPSSTFRLVRGADALREYRYATRRDAHYFCGRCGINTFSTGESPALGPFHAVVLACLDDATPEELAAAPVRYLDGRNDNWVTPPAEVHHL
ncbi:GFA family protein [Telluria aromaticivorans]|uniref:GFA family protein n=1 Tax=Telluria aromaticivorans TaxID=2725995 RepID=A0A7Y2JW26_9BURK|nr:GFA family protein [Telluria aromaticivorans]NNG22096.1 GFA family protein [Telluria aromaticivorans]